MLKKSKRVVSVDETKRLAEFMSKIPQSSPERQSFLMTALNWSQLENPEAKKFEGHPQLHQTVANVFWQGIIIKLLSVKIKAIGFWICHLKSVELNFSKNC